MNSVAAVLAGLSIVLTIADGNSGVTSDTAKNARIVGGWDAEVGQFPYQLFIRKTTRVNGIVSACGGIVIHSEWGLTAAHCVSQRITVIISAGAQNITRPHYIFDTTEYFQNPLYNNLAGNLIQQHDISILKFNYRLQYSALVHPLRIQNYEDRNKNFDGVILTSSGYGSLGDGNEPESEVLKWSHFRGVTNEYCDDAYKEFNIVYPNTLCGVYYNDTAQSICHADSGGPVTFVDEDGQRTLVALNSFGSYRCQNGPSGFLRISYYHEWLTEVTGIDFSWSFDIESSV